VSTIEVRASNLFGFEFTTSQIASLVGQTPTLTLDGDWTGEGLRGQATIEEAATSEGGGLHMRIALPEGTRARDLGRETVRDVAIGYIVLSSRTVRLHTIAGPEAAAETGAGGASDADSSGDV
jgi:hypothetical protein